MSFLIVVRWHLHIESGPILVLLAMGSYWCCTDDKWDKSYWRWFSECCHVYCVTNCLVNSLATMSIGAPVLEQHWLRSRERALKIWYSTCQELYPWFLLCWFNIKMSSCQYKKSHCRDKTIISPQCFSFTGKMAPLYWINAKGLSCNGFILVWYGWQRRWESYWRWFRECCHVYCVTNGLVNSLASNSIVAPVLNNIGWDQGKGHWKYDTVHAMNYTHDFCFVAFCCS